MTNESQLLQIDTERVRTRVQQHFAVIDIGSNSIRLVVYDDLSRSPFPRFNEKALCALGAGIDDEGRLTGEAIERAVHAVRRFDAIAKAMRVEQVHVIATEATRRASNGNQLVAAIRASTGLEVRVLSGEEEANYAACGVIAGFYKPKGLSGDLGGGSLEVAEVLGDRVGERLVSMPLGALPVLELLRDGIDPAKKAIDAILHERLPPMLTEPVFYAIGGGWRALARVHLAMNSAPISVVHGYEIDADELRSLAKKVARMSRDEVAALPDVPSRRIETLPAAALVLSRLLRNLKPERVVFSLSGLREGWLYSQLDETEQARDPLLEGAQAVGLPTARVAGFAAALANWTDDLFPGESRADRRLRLAVCALSDIAWRDHDKVKAEQSLQRLLQFPFVGVSHAERAFIAIAVMSRYGGRLEGERQQRIAAVLSASQFRRAEILGRALQLGHRFSASVPEILQEARLRIDADAVRLELLNRDRMPDSDAVLDRLRQLGKVSGVDGVDVVDVVADDH